MARSGLPKVALPLNAIGRVTTAGGITVYDVLTCDLLAVSQTGAGRAGPDACRRRVPAHGRRTAVSVPGTRALCARGSAVIAAVCGPHADRLPRQHGISTFRCRGVVRIRDQELWIHRLCRRGPKGFVVLAYPAGRPASGLDRECH